MSMRDGWRELRDAYRTNPVGLFRVLLGFLVYGGIHVTLMAMANHPRAAGSTCNSRCLIEAYWFSPHLLGGGLVQWLLFGWLWLQPILIIGFLIYSAKMGKLRNPFSNSNSPPE